MPSKKLIMLFMVIGSFVGGGIPALLGASAFSFFSLTGSFIGSIAGIYLGYKISQ